MGTAQTGFCFMDKQPNFIFSSGYFLHTCLTSHNVYEGRNALRETKMSQFGHNNIVRAEFQQQLKYIILKRIFIYACDQTDLLQLLLLFLI